MASQILHSMTTPSLDLFYNNSNEPSEMQTQRKSIKRPSKCQSSQNLERKQSRNYQQQFLKSPDSEYSLPADLVEQRQTKILSLKNIQFFKEGRLLTHNHDELEFVDCVSITFEQQKKDEKRIRSHRWHRAM
jgi:hypothetical protein